MYHAKSPGDYTRRDVIRHTARMNLLTLNLHASLTWNQAEAAAAGILSAADALAAADEAPDSAEIAMVWGWDAVVDSTGDDGPHARRPVPSPARVASTGLRPGAPAASPERLEAGRYLFAQTRRPADSRGAATGDWLADTVDWFVREAWWTGAQAEGPLIVRLVREDGKTAAQLIRRLGLTSAAPESLHG